jgi:hypothetical protein
LDLRTGKFRRLLSCYYRRLFPVLPGDSLVAC